MSEQSEGPYPRPKTQLEEFFRPESRLSSIDKPEFRGGENRGEYCWRVIRHCVKDAIDVVTRADVRNVGVGHGIHHGRMINHAESVHDMIYNKLTKEYITLESNTVRVYLGDGRKRDAVSLEENFSQILHASQPDLFVGWTKGDRKLYLMTNEFEVQSVSNAEGPVSMVVYNENIGEIVTIGPGYLTSWVFRYGGRHILPRRSTHAGLFDHDDFSHMVLEETASRNQKAFAACGTRVAVFNLFEGKLLEWRKELHVRPITAMVYFNPLKYLITAAKDGSIKVWNEKWHLQLVFVGHSGLVTSLAIYPYGPNIMSASMDNTIRVWSLETCDEVDKVKTADPVESLGTLVNTDNFYSFAGSHGDLWKVKHIHTLHARIGHKVMLLKTTDHPEFPIRTVCLCRDSSVRIICPANGEVLTTLLMDSRRNLVDAAYAIAEDELYAVFANGDIVKANTGTNPCTVMDEWKCNDITKACNYLLVYEYVISAEIQGDSWGGITRALDAKGLVSRSNSSKASNRGNRTLLLGGRKDGYICVFDMDTGEVEFEIEGHGIKGVLSMIANSKNDQLISCGLDNIIKVWRLYPYAQESLAPLMSFYCAHTPIFMNVMRNKLAVAFQEHTTATYSVVMYNLQTKNRHDHSPEDDHMDAITGLSVCQKLRLIVSASLDGSLHVWNEKNNIIRTIKLNATPYSVCFCSHKGDLLVGVGEHIHKIDYKHYMPKSYRTKMISMSFPIMEEEKALPYDENLLNQLHKEDVKRLKAARSSFKFTHFMDILTADENDEVMREKKLREAAFAKIDARDKEMQLIRDGELLAIKKPQHTAVTKTEGFEKYLDIFYHRPKAMMLPEEDLEFELNRALEGPKKQDVEKYHQEREPVGFFPPPSQAIPPIPPPKKAKPAPVETADEEHLAVEKPISLAPPDPEPIVPSIRADCYIPNSVLVRLLFPQRSIDEAKKKKVPTATLR